jgi:hypothetical protein
MYQVSVEKIQNIIDLRQVGGFLWFSGFLHQQNWPPRYNRNIVESGVQTQ